MLCGLCGAIKATRVRFFWGGRRAGCVLLGGGARPGVFNLKHSQMNAFLSRDPGLGEQGPVPSWGKFCRWYRLCLCWLRSNAVIF